MEAANFAINGFALVPEVLAIEACEATLEERSNSSLSQAALFFLEYIATSTFVAAARINNLVNRAINGQSNR
jgi:hypothetical protein